MDARMIAAVSGSLQGVNVAGLCRQLGISRQSLYKWRARYVADGLAGLDERSRRPQRSPQRLSPGFEDVIVEYRKRLQDEGLDAGAATIRWHLGRDGTRRPPSEATIWRVLSRRGMITPQPSKRPKAATRRFEADHPNERWQADHTGFALADGTEVQILNLLDDHSRLCVASVAAPTITKQVLWAAFEHAGGCYGFPSSCMSDNGLVFSGKLRGYEVDFEIRLRALGIKPIVSRPFHPQTCGKVERFQQTLKKWLRAKKRRLETLAELQDALDAFRRYYNCQRPHRGIGRVTPEYRWTATPPAVPNPTPLPAPQRRGLYRINTEGRFYYRDWQIHLGIEYADKTANVIANGHHLSVFVDGHLARALTIDPKRIYQGSGRPPGGPRRRPL